MGSSRVISFHRQVSALLEIPSRVFRLGFRSEQLERTREPSRWLRVARVPMDLISNRGRGGSRGLKRGQRRGSRKRGVESSARHHCPRPPFQLHAEIAVRSECDAVLEIARGRADRRSVRRHLCFTLQQSSIGRFEPIVNRFLRRVQGRGNSLLPPLPSS